MGEARLWQDLKRPELEALAKENDIALLPCGSTEQHGPHLPMGSDFYNAIGIATRASEKTGCVVAPPLPYGAHPYFHFGYQGTLPIRQTIYIEMIRDIVKGIVNSGFNKVIICNAHGQWWTLNTAVQEIALEVNAWMGVVTWQEQGLPTINEVLSTPAAHADESETAVALHLYPEKVEFEKGVAEGPHANIDLRFLKRGCFGDNRAAFCVEGSTAYPQEGLVMEHGIKGDPTLATAEKGRTIIEAVTDFIANVVTDLRSRYKVGEAPPVKPKLRVDYY